MNIIQNIKNQIESVVKDGVNKAGYEADVIEIEIPANKSNGDFSVNTAMKLTKTAKRPPREIATAIVEAIDTDGTYIDRVEIAGPGFINFYLNEQWRYDGLKAVLSEGENFGRTNIGNGKKVMVEFVSANPTGPMHMGNARGGALGDTLANALSWAGFDVTKEFYVNDAGAQIEKFGKSLEARYIQQLKGEDAFEFPEDGYQGDDIREHAKNFIAINGDKYLDCDSDTRRKALVDYALELNVQGLVDGLAKYRIFYDVWFRESTIHANGEVAQTIEDLKKSGITYEKDGALWIKTTEFGSEKDEVLIRANGIPTYFAVDIAYHKNKFAIRNFDKVINVWGADHHGHVARMKGAMDAIGIDSSKLEIVIMQLVRLMRNGEVARMSKRTGKMITMNDLIDEIGCDAARFFFNLRQAGSHLDFDLDLAIAQNSDNPVFYVQYAHARICSIIRTLESEGITLGENADLTLLTNPEELALTEKIISLPDEINQVADSLEPSRLTRYVLDLAALFHSFYNSCKVNTDDAALTQARLTLVYAARTVIRNVFEILKVTAPEKM
ncbi:MAG: arginine--tRNA ligase [Ruminococcaceae bacterium]|nr:arginine--tRNA ligase [Oscillospiraceae bacterium]